MTVREDRLSVRIDANAKRRLEDAASEVHLSLSAFVLQAGLQQADQVLAERELIKLSPEAAAAFTEAFVRPARVNNDLARALARPPKFGWLD